MCGFITQVKKMDGTNFPPKMLYEIIVCIQMGLEMHGLHWKFFKDAEFHALKYTVDNEMKLRTRQGLSQAVKQADIITEEQEDFLWNCGLLGKDTPLQLFRTLLYVIGINLALRAGKEYQALCSIGKNSQLSFGVQNGQRIVYYQEDIGTKTNQGGLRHKKLTRKKVTIFPSENAARCPVSVIYKYHCKLPNNQKNDALYLRPRMDSAEKDVWYYDMPVGINKLQSVVKELCHEAGFTDNYTNHSLSSTSATHMYRAGIDEQTICEITGHRSNAIRAYKRTSDNLKCKA